MKLIIGGSYQGKLNYVLEKEELKLTDVFDGGAHKLEEVYEKSVLNHFHLLIGRLMEKEYNIDIIMEEIESILTVNPNIIIITNELGCGIVPMDKQDRVYREVTGRICCKLAKRADRVYRVVCGIGTLIKENI